jgi:hypothetical protein
MADVAAWAGPGVPAAVITAAGAVLVAVASWFGASRSARTLETSKRRERVKDTQMALIAEIRGNLRQFNDMDFDEIQKSVFAAIANGTARRPYTPFVPKFAHTFVFETILPDISVLPSDVIEGVVKYYKAEYKLSLFADDLRGEVYAELPPERKQLAYADYLVFIKFAQKTGRAALKELEISVQRH